MKLRKLDITCWPLHHRLPAHPTQVYTQAKHGADWWASNLFRHKTYVEARSVANPFIAFWRVYAFHAVLLTAMASLVSGTSSSRVAGLPARVCSCNSCSQHFVCRQSATFRKFVSNDVNRWRFVKAIANVIERQPHSRDFTALIHSSGGGCTPIQSMPCGIHAVCATAILCAACAVVCVARPSCQCTCALG